MENLKAPLLFPVSDIDSSHPEEVASEIGKGVCTAGSKAAAAAPARPSKESMEKQKRAITHGRYQLPPLPPGAGQMRSAPISPNVLVEPYKYARFLTPIIVSYSYTSSSIRHNCHIYAFRWP